MADITARAKKLQKNFELIVFQFQTAAAVKSESSDSLSMQETNAIDYIGRCKGCIMREIAEYLHVAVSTVTGLVDKLEEKELVKRERSSEDRRVIRITLTAKGEDVYQFRLQEFIRLCSGMLTGLTDQEQETYIELSDKIARNAREIFTKAGNGNGNQN
ncbi:hypothetical protein BH10ACI1_BH10ACI1_06420 [soil metagenome]